ncbi:class I SAM-dependent methyltransferase [Neomicrococcus aestuarii]|uniref:class I SAM-dependent methyltransferase n=1 Tax=Neomicrococcus aestuarii TaxID=556325 RepID=UPI000A9C8214|nr:class I SAM-dependent methyltransferase [Neomicrococcus aestuarii]
MVAVVRKAERLSKDTHVGAPVGNVTRGTTHPHRMRRVDRWLTGTHGALLRGVPSPLAVDLGFGASPVTTLEMFEAIRAINPTAHVTGLEIEKDRVLLAQQSAREGLDFAVGGFELGTSQRPLVVRAFNVLRQYQEDDVAAIWTRMTSRLAPGGLLIEGTCNEIGRVATWVALREGGPESLTIAMRFGSFELPSDAAERLPKALIHRNVPGERIHDFLKSCDDAWLVAAPVGAFGTRQRWIRMCESLKNQGWPIIGGVTRWRLGELTVAWDAVRAD